MGRPASWSKSATPCTLCDGALALDPAADHGDDVVALLGAQLAALLDPVAALEAAAAAGRGGVLGDEHRVAAVRRLLAVLVRGGGREPPGDQAARVLLDRVH